MDIQCVANLADIDSIQWNALVPTDAPFVRHEFLTCLENAGCVTPESGWLPHHVVIKENNNIIAAMPFYIKGHSYGEYVFDWAWADAYHRHGLEYYPKGLIAIPFTPTSSPKFLVHPDHDMQELSSTMVNHALKVAGELKLSSVHSLFLSELEQQHWNKAGFLNKTGYQFHWQNNAYSNFNAYLNELSSSKRKKIRQERKAVINAGVTIEVKIGSQISNKNWRNFHRFYQDTVRSHGAIAYLNEEFFLSLGESLTEHTILILASKDNENIASALFFRGSQTLYGRYWGSQRYVKHLHFELCYYQAIEYCIEHELKHFEAGAQGEHKLARGLLPVQTHSSHWLRHPEFFNAVADHVEHESEQVERYIELLQTHSPFRAA